MTRSTRLFDIIQILRRASKPMRAADIARAVEVSERTIYRDMVTLQAMRIPIEGAAGIGYVMRRGYDLPPVNFDIEEAEAITLALSMIARTGDAALTRAAGRAARKLNDIAGTPSYLLDAGYGIDRLTVDPAQIRTAIRDEQVLRISYEDAQGKATTRDIWPLALIFYPDTGVLVAWCLMRADFRHFRLDRITTCSETGEDFAGQSAALRQDWTRAHYDDMLG